MKKTLALLFALLCIVTCAFVLASCGDEGGEDGGSNNPPVGPTVTAIAIKTPAEKLTFLPGDTFSSTGLTIEATLSDGTTKTLTETEYSVSTTGFDTRTPNTYAIEVLYVDDVTVKCSYNVLVPALTAISADSGYVNAFVVGDYIEFDKINLSITETYSDGSTRSFSGEDLSSQGYHFDYMASTYVYESATDQKITIQNLYQSELTTEITYNVYTVEEMTPKSVSISKPTTVTTWALEDASTYENQNLGLEVVATFVETGTRQITLASYQYTIDCSELASATEAGAYNVSITLGDAEPATYSVTLVSTQGYTLTDVELVYGKDLIKTYYVKEDFDYENATNSISVNKILTKAGSADMKIPVGATLNINTSTDTAGTISVTVSLFVDSQQFEKSYQITVKDIPTYSDGEYLRDNYGGRYSKYIKINHGNFMFLDYSTQEYVGGYTVSSVSKVSVGTKQLYMISFSNGKGGYESIYMTLEGELYETYYRGANDFEVSIMMDQRGQYGKTTTLWAIDGVLTLEEDTIKMMQYYDLHLDAVDGTVITADYAFTKDSSVYLVFEQQDATGKSFLGSYEGEYVINVNANGLEIVGQMTMNYKYQEGGSSVTLTAMSYATPLTFNIVGNTMSIDTGEGVMTFTKK